MSPKDVLQPRLCSPEQSSMTLSRRHLALPVYSRFCVGSEDIFLQSLGMSEPLYQSNARRSTAFDCYFATSPHRLQQVLVHFGLICGTEVRRLSYRDYPPNLLDL